MIRSTRGAVALGLCFAGVAGLAARSFGQGDAAVRKASVPAAGATATPAAGPAEMKIASNDMDAVLKNYHKFQVATETIRSEAMARHGDLLKLAGDAKAEQEKIKHFTNNPAEIKKCEERFVQLKAQVEAGRENAQREFQQKEAETMATIYNDIQAMVKLMATKQGYTFVVKYSDQAATASDPDSVMAAMGRTVMYADNRTDITSYVIQWLNQRYKQSGGVAPRANNTPATAAPAPGARTATPAPGAGGN